jgi:hypothetical protein
MTISINVNQIRNIGDVVSTVFPYKAPLIASSDLKVFVNGVRVMTGTDTGKFQHKGLCHGKPS